MRCDGKRGGKMSERRERGEGDEGKGDTPGGTVSITASLKGKQRN